MEVTNAEYCEFLNSAIGSSVYVAGDVVYGSGNEQPYCDTHGSSSYSQIDYSGSSFTVRTKGGRDMSNDPMVQVSWYGAAAYCNWRSIQDGRQQCYNLSTWDCDFNNNGYHLPTEAQWEYAARGGLNGKRFPWGDTISHDLANYFSVDDHHYDISQTRGYHPDWNDGISPYTSPGGSFQANGYGLYDMSGNVKEWCNDWYDPDYYDISPQNNPTGPAAGNYRALRDNGWNGYSSGCRAAARSSEFYPYYRRHYWGFRIAVSN
jgi:formylglycine-generating enzyme required for sulfatase activity